MIKSHFKSVLLKENYRFKIEIIITVINKTYKIKLNFVSFSRYRYTTERCPLSWKTSLP